MPSLQCLDQAVELIEVFQQGNANHRQFGQGPSVGDALHPCFGLRQDLHCGDNRLQTPAVGLLLKLPPLIGPDAEQRRVGCSARGDHQIAEITDKLIGERLKLHSLAERGFETAQCGGTVARDQCFDNLNQPIVGSGSQQSMHVRVGDFLGTKRQKLVEQGLAVTHRTGCAARNQLQRRRIDLEAFSLGKLTQADRDVVDRDRTEVEPLTAGEDRVGHLVRLGRTEHELHQRRRLFQRLEQRVERLLGQHVNFVDDVDLVLRPHRLDADVGPERSNVVDPAIGSPVDFRDIHIVARRDPEALLTPITRHAVLRVRTVQSLGENTGHRGLADAACPRKQIGMRDAAFMDRVPQRLRNPLLPDNLGKRLRPKPPSQHGVLGIHICRPFSVLIESFAHLLLLLLILLVLLIPDPLEQRTNAGAGGRSTSKIMSMCT